MNGLKGGSLVYRKVGLVADTISLSSEKLRLVLVLKKLSSAGTICRKDAYVAHDIPRQFNESCHCNQVEMNLICLGAPHKA